MSLSLSEQMQSNGFFPRSLDRDQVRQRVWELERGKVGSYSVGLIPHPLLTTVRCSRRRNLCSHLGPGTSTWSLAQSALDGMDPQHVASVERMGTHAHEGGRRVNSLADLLKRCKLVVLSANSNHVEDQEACRLREDPRAAARGVGLSRRLIRPRQHRQRVVCALRKGAQSGIFLRVPSAWSSAQSPRQFHGQFRHPTDSTVRRTHARSPLPNTRCCRSA